MATTAEPSDATRRRWLLIIGVVLGLLTAAPWFTPFGPVTAEPWGLFAAVVTAGTIGGLSLLAACRPDSAGALRQALAFLATANLLVSAGNLLRLLLVWGLPEPRIPYLAEVSEFAIWVLGLLAMVRVPLRPIAPRDRWRFALDLAISFLGMAFILFVIWRLPGLRHATPAARQRLMFYNWMEGGNLLVLNLILLRGSTPRLRLAMRWLAAAVAMDTVYLVVFQYLTGLENYDGRILNSLFFVDNFLYIVAAYHFFRPPPETADATGRPVFATTNPLPFCTVLGVGVLLLLSAADSPAPAVRILAGGTVLMSFLLLARVVASTRESLQLAQEKLASEQRAQLQKMEAVGRLAGGVAHDFNNLLAVVMANSELASLGLPPGHPSRPDLEEIQRTAARGSALTGRLLALGRRQNLRPKLVSPGRLLQQIEPVLLRTVGEAVRLSIAVPGDVGSVWVEPHDFEQAMIILTSNACDALPKTGGTLAISVRMQTISQPLVSEHLGAPPGRYVVVTATDNGAGMDAKTRTHLFEPFFSTKGHGRGSGLGLAAVFGMVKAAGGGIVLESAPHQGTTIELWLPEKPETLPAATVAPAPVVATPAGRRTGESILLVEDETGVRVTIKRLLELEGYIVLAAGNAQEARQVLTQPGAREVKLLLTDVIMPGQSGPTLAADLVREHPKLKVLFMSGYTGDELRTDKIMSEGAQLLVKPFTGEELLARVRQLLADPGKTSPGPTAPAA